MQKLPKAKYKNIVVQQANKDLLLYDLISNKAFCLNETSAFIWQLCDGKNSVENISRQLSKHFNANLDENFVWLAIEQFKRDGLLDEKMLIEIDFGGLSRRQVIKKVGLATMIALPLISSVVAPNAAMSQSVSCIQAGQQVSGNVPGFVDNCLNDIKSKCCSNGISSLSYLQLNSSGVCSATCSPTPCNVKCSCPPFPCNLSTLVCTCI